MIFKYFTKFCCKDLQMLWKINHIRLAQHTRGMVLTLADGSDGYCLRHCLYCGAKVEVTAVDAREMAALEMGVEEDSDA